MTLVTASTVMKLCTLLADCTAAVHFQADPTQAKRAQEGKEHLEKITSSEANHGCWAAAVENLHAGCKGMDEDVRSKLAVQVRSARETPHNFTPALTAHRALVRSSPIATCQRAASRRIRAPRR